MIVRIEAQTLMFLDPDTRELLRVRPNPLTPEQALRLQGARPAGPPPRPRTAPVTVQRTVSATGVITVCRQPVSLGRVHAGRTVTVHVSEHTLAIELDDETAPSAARPPAPSWSSRPTGRTDRRQRQRNSRQARAGKRSITNRKESRRWTHRPHDS